MRNVRNNKSSSTTQVVAEFSALEARQMMCGDHLPSPAVQGTPAGYSPATHTGAIIVPVLSSKPGAKATLFLDFDGDAASSWGSYNVTATPAYNGSTAAMTEIFTRVAEKFSSFDINVTTVNPGSFADKKALHAVIGGAGAWTGVTCGGLSYVGAFANAAPNTVYIFPDNLGGGFPKYVAEAVSHESGHAFGLQHQSFYSTLHAKLAEYSNNGGSMMSAPTMGNSYSSARGTWWKGTDSYGVVQDDMAVIGSNANGFGYRADDYGSSFATAKGMKFSSNKFNVKGTIEKTTDSDQFVFTVTSKGVITLKVRGAAYGATLDSSLRLYRPDGTVVAKVDTASLGETMTKGLTPGKYIAIVSSKGNAGDVGQYQLTAEFAPATAPAALPSAPVARSAMFSSTPISSTTTIDDLMAA